MNWMRRRRGRGRALAWAVALVVWAASPSVAADADVAASSDAEAQTPWNVLLLTVDCLRPDHLSMNGYPRDTTPQLDAFAKDAWIFDNAFATSAWTSPGIVSMLTGYYPPVHGQNARHSFYDDELASPLRVLQERGYTTIGRNASRANYGGLGLQEQVGGVDFEWFVRERATEAEPFFAWLHSKEPHLPYRASEANAGRYTAGIPETPGTRAVQEHHVIFRDPSVPVRFEHAGAVEFVEGDVPAVRALYDETVRDADDHLGRAFEALRETGLLERTVVIISADHGEELFEHGWVGHASTSYDGKLTDELVRIPLIVRIPGGGAGRSAALVQGIDLMPTLFALLGLDPARVDPPMQGVSLVPLFEEPNRSVREHAFLQTTRKGWTTPADEMRRRVTAVRSRDRKVVWWPAEGGRPARVEAFDLETDPAERRDLYPTAPERFEGLVRARAAWDEANRRHATALVTQGGRHHRAAQQKAIGKGDLEGAMQDWRRLFLLHRTWGYEESPFHAHPGEGEAWRRMMREASRSMAAALEEHAASTILPPD